MGSYLTERTVLSFNSESEFDSELGDRFVHYVVGKERSINKCTSGFYLAFGTSLSFGSEW